MIGIVFLKMTYQLYPVMPIKEVSRVWVRYTLFKLSVHKSIDIDESKLDFGLCTFVADLCGTV